MGGGITGGKSYIIPVPGLLITIICLGRVIYPFCFLYFFFVSGSGGFVTRILQPELKEDLGGDSLALTSAV